MRRMITVLTSLALLAACGGDPTATRAASTARVAASVTGEHPDPAVQRDLATLRRVTARFHDFATAKQAGWDTKITPCMTDPAGTGGMGFHYGNTNLIDGSVRVDQPELLLYEPEKNGRLRLVAVEYIVPFGLSAQAPHLFGRDFKPNQQFQVWALHAWVWKENPDGILADWNPTVSCAYTTDIMAMTH